MKYAFGNVSVDADARTVSRAAAQVHLTRKAFDLLLLLLERRPGAVSKEQIFARLWPDTFVAESSLQTLIHEIRQAIDEPGPRSSWVRTVHGIGYSFAGDVVCSEQSFGATEKRAAAWLVSESERVALHAGENIIGRGAENVVEIESPTISRRHARISIGEAATIEDLGSKNGSSLNDQQLTAQRALADGDVVRLGSVTFTFRLARQAAATESAESAFSDHFADPRKISDLS